ncbi:MATH domain and coiled-coil domain-containing protein At3g58410-like [Pistacia vera]|uniref:MATH domain and coiled-coil domain-containing protein At3g58410-like n=1 Tax=Pistacia vera TaxID=55513 RepID=UPI00126312F6|nr:MATH domain and coiled-coil domain-containing protein At3g58410-like [Pistacia vera]XP_031272506.1 MATH domain and coiled-coil domain-containing protein At3g58410-like [Pistacia vera]
MKTEWGIAKFIDLKAFHNPLKGYHIDHTCVFSAEVFVVKSTFKEECLSMIKEPATCYHVWKITKISTLLDETCASEPFGDYNWKISFYPNGCLEAKGNNISTFLLLLKESIPLSTKLFVKFILRVKDQTKENHVEIEFEQVFSPILLNWDARKFMSLHKLEDPKQSFLVDNTCIIEAEVTVPGLIKT